MITCNNNMNNKIISHCRNNSKNLSSKSKKDTLNTQIYMTSHFTGTFLTVQLEVEELNELYGPYTMCSITTGYR